MIASSTLLCPALIVIGFLLLSLLESTRPLHHERHRKSPRVARNLALAAIGILSTRLIVLPWVLAASQWGQTKSFGLLTHLPQTPWLRYLIAFLAFDYTMYLWHRLNHQVPFFWRFHAVHHADLDLDVSTSARFHFGELILSGVFRCLQAILIGLDPLMLLYGETVVTIASEFHHSNFRLPRRLEENLLEAIVTPRMHLVHHSIVKGETNSNFGVVLTFWDRLHRSLRLGIPENQISIGIPALRQSSEVSLKKLLTMPFRTTPRWEVSAASRK